MKPANQALHDLEQIARRIRERAAVVKGEAFPDPVGEDRDRRRVIVWDFTKG